MASHAQKPMVNHLPRSNGLKSICLTRSSAGLIGSITLISGRELGRGSMGISWCPIATEFRRRLHELNARPTDLNPQRFLDSRRFAFIICARFAALKGI